MQCNWHPFMAFMVEFHVLNKSHTQVSYGQIETDRLRSGYNINLSLNCRLVTDNFRQCKHMYGHLMESKLWYFGGSQSSFYGF